MSRYRCSSFCMVSKEFFEGVGHRLLHLSQRLQVRMPATTSSPWAFRRNSRKSLLAGRWIAGEGHARRRVFPHVAEHHRHDRHGRTKVVRNSELLAVGDGSVVVPGVGQPGWQLELLPAPPGRGLSASSSTMRLKVSISSSRSSHPGQGLPRHRALSSARRGLPRTSRDLPLARCRRTSG